VAADRNIIRRYAPVLLTAVLASSASGCAIDADTFTMPELKKPDWSTFTRPDWTMAAKKTDPLAHPIGQEDLIGANGRCANEMMAPAAQSPQALNFTAGPEAGRPDRPAPEVPAAPAPTQPAARGVGLGMSECEVVYALGHTDRIEVANDRGQRTATLTYAQGPRPGIYRFTAGRLVSIERGPEAPAPARPEKKTAKKPPVKKPSNS
jgi:hypothetical protein